MNEFRTLLPYIRPYWRGIAMGLSLVVVANAFSIAGPKILGLAIDALEAPGTTWRVILGYAGLVVLVALIGGVARYGMRELLNGISRRIEVDFRDALFDNLLGLDSTFYGRHRTGDLMSRATNDTQAVRQAIGPAVMYLVNTVVMTAFALTLMVRVSLELTLMALIPMVLLPPVMLYFARLIHARFERIQDHFGDLSTMIQENLSGARIVRAYRQEAPQASEFGGLNAEYLDKNMALARVEGLFRPLLTTLAGVGMVIVLYFGGREVIAGNISVGDFVAFGIYLTMLTWPMIALGWVINLFQRGAASLARINEIFNTDPAVQQAADPVRLPGVRGEIEFDDVYFRYPGTEREVLCGVSFHARAGQTIALVGPTGSGKSTIVELLTRRYDPTAGEIRLDGVPLTRVDLEQLRAAIGMAPQDAFLFSETIGENIALGLPSGTDGNGHDEIREATSIAQLEPVIDELPHGFDTRLGERGINLSGGQRQRTTLARALAREPRILILDDTLSAVDTHTETEILRGLRRVLGGRTSVIISHRVTAVMAADQILVIDDGRIVERGTHPELIERDGLYASLLHRQLLAEDLEGETLAAASAHS